jgi:hypothetical protein
MADGQRDALGTGTTGAEWSRPAHRGQSFTVGLIDLIAGQEFRGVQRMPCTLVVLESRGTKGRAAGHPTGGI